MHSTQVIPVTVSDGVRHVRMRQISYCQDHFYRDPKGTFSDVIDYLWCSWSKNADGVSARWYTNGMLLHTSYCGIPHIPSEYRNCIKTKI